MEPPEDATSPRRCRRYRTKLSGIFGTFGWIREDSWLINAHSESRKPTTGRRFRWSLPPSRRRADLRTLEGVRSEMARQYREMEAGRRESQDGSRLVYVLTQIAKVLELTEIERRLTILEGKNG
jgi:hypothetical protein